MHTQFDKIYVISLITNKDRQEFIKYQFNELGLDFEFIYTADYYNFENLEWPDAYINTLHHTHGTAKDFGCTIGHYQAVMQAYHLGYNNVLIFEDDVCLNTDKLLWESMLNNIPEFINFIDYDPRCGDQTNLLNSLKTAKNNYILLNDELYWGAAMYAIMNRETMKLYLDNQHKCFKMSDNLDGFFENLTVKRYVPSKCLFIDQYTYNNIFINNDFSCECGYENKYFKIHNYNEYNFFKPNVFHEFSRLY